VVDSNVILARIARIRECLVTLRRYAVLGEKTFLSNPEVTGNAERQLQVAIQAVIDMVQIGFIENGGDPTFENRTR
jgi:uncharacterized protein YutE (UPF0331/DUF86 family)